MAETKDKGPEPELATSETPQAGTGIELFGGSLFRQEDYNPDLQGQNGCLVYEKMRRGDPDVAAGLAHILWPLLSANWRFEPADDSDEEREIADFCAKWIFGEGRSDPFAMDKLSFLRHALLMITDGFAAFEKVWGTTREGKQVYAKLVPILPKSVYSFEFFDEPGGSLKGLTQYAWVLGEGYKWAKVPAEKLALFVFAKEGDNFFGWPILRAAYKPWLHKEKLEIIDGIRIERNGIGFTVITIPSGSKDKVREKAKSLAQSLRVHERQGVVVEEGTKVDILYPTGNDPKIVESMNFRRSQILGVLISEFIEHGSANVGSKALVGEKIDFMLLTLQGTAAEVCTVINRQLIPELVYRNFGAREVLPRAVCDEISTMSGSDISTWLVPFMQPGVQLIRWDPDLEQFVREKGKLPRIPDDVMDKLREVYRADLDNRVKNAKNPPQRFLIGADPLAPRDPGADPEEVEADPEERREEDPKEPEKKPVAASLPRTMARSVELWRELLPHESLCEFSAMKSFLTDEPVRVWHKVIAPVRETMIRKTAERLVEMTDAQLRGGTVEIPLKTKLTEKLRRPFLEVYLRGRKEVAMERKRQLAVNAAAGDEEDEEEEVVVSASQVDWIKTLAGTYVVGLLASMAKRGILEATNVRQAELPKDEQQARIEAALRDLSEGVAQAELAGKLTTAFTTGREEQAEEYGDEIVTAYYSAVMDDGTEKCTAGGGTCEVLDGDEHEAGDSAYTVPNPNCAWPSNCRCVNIYVYRKKEEAA